MARCVPYVVLMDIRMKRLDGAEATRLLRVRPGTPPVPVLTMFDQVLSLIGTGATNPEIAARLSIAEGTVKTHIGGIFTKLDLRDRAAAVIYALRHGLTGDEADA